MLQLFHNPPSPIDSSEPLCMCVMLRPTDDSANATFQPYISIHNWGAILTQYMHQGVGQTYTTRKLTSHPSHEVYCTWQLVSQPARHLTHRCTLTSMLFAGVCRLVWPRLAYYLLSHLSIPFCITYWELEISSRISRSTAGGWYGSNKAASPPWQPTPSFTYVAFYITKTTDALFRNILTQHSRNIHRNHCLVWCWQTLISATAPSSLPAGWRAEHNSLS